MVYRKRKNIFDIFDNFFNKILRDMESDFWNRDDTIRDIFEELDEKFFAGDFPPSDFFENISSSPNSSRYFGYTINWESVNGQKPRIHVKRFSSDPRMNAEFQIFPDSRKLSEPNYRERIQITDNAEHKREIDYRKITYKEPEIKMDSTQDSCVISVILPDIKRKEDIEIRGFEESYEIRAVNRNTETGYFCIIKKPQRFLAIKPRFSFKDGVLKIIWKE